MSAVARTPPEILWVTPATDRPSGGSLYNQRILAALRHLGVAAECWEVPGDWPRPAPGQVTHLHEKLLARRAAQPEASVVVDGLIAAAAPQLFSASGATRPADVLLMHLPVAFDGAEATVVEAEARAAAAAGEVVVTSRWAAEQLRGSSGRQDAEVIIPGVTPPAESVRGAAGLDHSLRPGGEAGFAVVASLTPRKNHRLLGEALSGVEAREGTARRTARGCESAASRWRLHLAGPGAETTFGRELSEELETRLPGRVVHHGTLDAEGLEQLWAQTDLMLLPSRAETYGMVVTEAAARGVPAFVAAGTGAVEAMGGAGRALPPDSPAAWREALHRWLTDPDERERWRTAAAARRDKLPTWEQSAHRWMRLVRSRRTG